MPGGDGSLAEALEDEVVELPALGQSAGRYSRGRSGSTVGKPRHRPSSSQASRVSRSGLAGVEPQLTTGEMLDHPAVAARLAAAVPHWRPGRAHGYRALTIGTLMDELTRRTVGAPIADFFRAEIGAPLGLARVLRGCQHSHSQPSHSTKESP